MAVAKPGGKLTYRDYLLMPEDGKRYELVEGELRMAPAPGVPHQEIAARLHILLHPEASRLGALLLFAPVDVFLDEHTVLQPDLLLVLDEHRERVTRRGVQGAPDLVIEILSPGTTDYDRKTKARLYAAAGVPEYWLASYEAGVIEVLVLGEDGYTVHCRAGYDEPVSSVVLPGLSFPASAAFAG